MYTRIVRRMAWLLYGLGYVLLDIRVRRALNQQFFRANPSNDIKAQFLGQRWVLGGHKLN